MDCGTFEESKYKEKSETITGSKNMEAQRPNLRMFNFQVLFTQEMAWRKSIEPRTQIEK